MDNQPSRESLQQATDRLIEATKSLTINELAELCNYFDEGPITEIKDRPWGHRVAHLLPTDGSYDSIQFMWITLVEVHGERLRAER